MQGPPGPHLFGLRRDTGTPPPERCPTLEEYEAAKRRYSRPIWASDEEAQRAWDRGPAFYLEILAATRIDRAGVPSAE